VATARYVNCRSLPLPKDKQTLAKVENEFIEVDYILITKYVLSKEIWKEWWPIFRKAENFSHFRLIKTLSNGELLYQKIRASDEPI